MKTRGILEIESGDYVKHGNTFKKIVSIYGVSEGGRLNKPSEGGFGVVTESGENISMWNAKSYHKKEDLENN